MIHSFCNDVYAARFLTCLAMDLPDVDYGSAVVYASSYESADDRR